MSSPTKKDLPKLETSLQNEISSPHHLKHTETAEKVSLPTAEDVKQEKTHQALVEGVEKGVELHHVKTREPASGAEVLRTELAHQTSVKEVGDFDKHKLKKVETNEKNPLPDQDAIRAEAEHEKFKQGIESFDKDKLTHASTVEKNTLPTKETIQQEKSA